MLKKIQMLLSGKTAPKTSADLAGALDEIDIDALRSAADEAAKRRAAMLLTADDEQILAAEREADAARLAVDRAEALRSELERRKAEAEEVERKAKIERQHREAKAALDDAVARIEAEYPALAQCIADLAAAASAADNAALEWNKLAMTDDHAAAQGRLASVAERVGWSAHYDVLLDFAGALRLLPLGGFEGHGVDFPPAEWRYAVYGSSAPVAAAHQYV